MQPRLTVILSLIGQMEKDLSVLKLQVQRLAEQEGEREYTMADLHGVLEGVVSSSEEDIDAVLYRMTPEFEEDIATLPKPDPAMAARAMATDAHAQ
ncbi:MAG: hypothetical protein ABI977_26840 [Acidobacteriota bacterium]